MDWKKWQKRAEAVLLILAVLALAAASGFCLWQYMEYGEENKEANTEPAKESARLIRVRIMSEDFRDSVHAQVELSCDAEYTVQHEQKPDEVREEEQQSIQTESASEVSRKIRSVQVQPAGSSLCVLPEDLEEDEMLRIAADGDSPVSITSLTRGDGVPQYYGIFYLYREGTGLALINEVPLEVYLGSVVSSEMLPDFPLEAQKAQAVAARTYAVNCISERKNSNCFEDLNDSVEFQVYNNYSCTEIAERAVEETKGEILPLQEVFYYSTSCLSEHRTDLSKEESFRTFLEEETQADAEYGSPWIRWSVQLPVSVLLENLQEQYGYGEDIIRKITVQERRKDGQLSRVLIQGEHEEVLLDGEYAIRKSFGSVQVGILLKDGTEMAGMQLLPSAYFYISDSETDRSSDIDGVPLQLLICGGGYGHGSGMSQYGAAYLAANGRNYTEILEYYYGESELLYEESIQSDWSGLPVCS